MSLVIYCGQYGAGKTFTAVADAIEDVNKAMKLSIELGCDIQFGQRYSEIH